MPLTLDFVLLSRSCPENACIFRCHV
jgi:hypothetical protein